MTRRALLLLGPLVAACSAPAVKVVERPAVELGESLFGDPDFSPSGNNYFACSDCHSRTTDEGGRLYAGYPLEGAANRASWWGGYELQLIDAASFCTTFFMRGQPIEPGDPYGDALYEYLASISPGGASPGLPVTITKTVTVIAGGDATNGELVYDAACRGCHGSPSGSGRLHSSITALDDDLWADYDDLFPGVSHRLLVTEKVRHGAFFTIGGVMPFFSQERLSDAELADVMAYLEL